MRDSFTSACGGGCSGLGEEGGGGYGAKLFLRRRSQGALSASHRGTQVGEGWGALPLPHYHWGGKRDALMVSVTHPPFSRKESYPGKGS